MRVEEARKEQEGRGGKRFRTAQRKSKSEDTMRHENDVRGLKFELAYLALLTQRGIKPLSRWEGAWEEATLTTLRALGLRTRVVRRLTQGGGEIAELLFSPSEQCLELYARRFADRALSHSATEVRWTGRLLGYPSCCVEHFARHGYAPNELSPEDQRILFHWACPRCALTPLLLSHYRRAYADCRRWRETGRWPETPVNNGRPSRRPAFAALAAAWTLGGLGSGTGAMAGGIPSDPHWLPLEKWQDPDHDFLTTYEERVL
jgi:hypothetical protein